MWNLPLRPCCSMRSRTSLSTCVFKAKSNSPVWITDRAAEVASPPPFSSTVSKKGRLGT